MFFDTITARRGEGVYSLEAKASFLGNDLLVSVGGGTSPHIGAVSLAVYEPLRNSATVSTLTVFSHRDDAVAAHFAKAISREMKCTVTVSAGIHIDDARQEDVKMLWDNSRCLCDELIAKLKSRMEEI